MIHPPGEKESFTVALNVRADGKKLPAVVVFKGAVRIGVLSTRIMKSLKIPANMIGKSSRSAWWSEVLDYEWIKMTFVVGARVKVLLRDRFTVHKMESSRLLLEERNVRQIFVPAG